MSNNLYTPANARRQTIWSVIAIVVVVLSLIQAIFISSGSAAQITNRKVTLSNSAGGATGVSYTVSSNALPTTGTAVKSVEAIACTTASGACTTPSGFSASSSTLSSQPTGLGCTTGWTVNTATAGNLRISNSGCATTPSGTVSIAWGGVANPTAQNSTFYLRIATYSGATWTGSLDNGTVAASTAQAINLTASVDESLTFCSGTSGITNASCSGATGSAVALGSLSASSTASGLSQLGVGTNGQYGYAITVNGASLTSGSNTIAANTTATASSAGTEQFGLNLRANTSPTVGADPDGSGTATPASGYNTVNSFQFNTGDTIASKASSDNFRRFQASYIANINPATAAGAYTATMTYIATATY